MCPGWYDAWKIGLARDYADEIVEDSVDCTLYCITRAALSTCAAPKNQILISFIAAKEPALVEQVLKLLKKK